MISAAHPSILKWQPRFLSNFIKFSIFAHTHTFFGLSPPTWGCHPPPSTGHTSLSLSIDSPGVFHAHPTLPSPWVTPRSILAHARAYFGHYHPFPVDFH